MFIKEASLEGEVREPVAAHKRMGAAPRMVHAGLEDTLVNSRAKRQCAIRLTDVVDLVYQAAMPSALPMKIA